MKILGSGKVDDFNKVQLSEKTTKALDVKSGDSVLFSRGGGHTVLLFKAEGANLSSEVDMVPPEKNDNKSASIVLGITIIAIIAMFTWFLLYSGYVDISTIKTNDTKFIVMLVFMVLLILLVIIALAMQFSHQSKSETGNSIVTFSGPYSKNRLYGISKLTSDGRILTGNLYVNALFGSNPSHIEARVVYADGSNEPVLCKCTKDVPGYCMYKLRVPAGDLTFGSLEVAISYVYSEKAIVARTRLQLSSKKEDAMSVRVEDGEVKAELIFGPDFQTAKFDESLFDPTDANI